MDSSARTEERDSSSHDSDDSDRPLEHQRSVNISSTAVPRPYRVVFDEDRKEDTVESNGSSGAQTDGHSVVQSTSKRSMPGPLSSVRSAEHQDSSRETDAVAEDRLVARKRKQLPRLQPQPGNSAITATDAADQPQTIASSSPLKKSSQGDDIPAPTTTSSIIPPLQFASAAEGRLAIEERTSLGLAEDDVAEVEAATQKWVSEIKAALLLQTYGAPPTTKQTGTKRSAVAMTDDDKAKWDEWQLRGLKWVKEEQVKGNTGNIAEKAAWILFEAVIKIHKHGFLPCSYAADCQSICSVRLQKVIDSIKAYTLIRKDVYRETNIEEFVTNPEQAVKRKTMNRTNNKKKQGELKAARANNPFRSQVMPAIAASTDDGDIDDDASDAKPVLRGRKAKLAQAQAKANDSSEDEDQAEDDISMTNVEETEEVKDESDVSEYPRKRRSTRLKASK